jgi:ATP-dependent DNA helicase RecG
MDLSTKVSEITGIGTRRGAALAKLGIFALSDALQHFPRTYEDRTKLVRIVDAEDGESVCISGVVLDYPRWTMVRKGMDVVKFKVADEDGVIDITYFNQSYVKDKFQRGSEYTFYGKIKRDDRFISMANPETERTGCIVPIYRLTAGISQNIIIGLVEKALSCATDGSLRDVLPEYIRTEYALMPVMDAYRTIHFPTNDALNSFSENAHSDSSLVKARRRLAFEEYFVLSLALKTLRSRNERESAFRLSGSVDYDEFYSMLPFTPTKAQKRSVEEAESDLISGKSMNRLIQGDVGSGKTLVAAALIWRVCMSGYQSAFMAPTEILAEQHYATLTKLLSPFGIHAVLLKGSMSGKEKQEVKKLLRSGEARLVIGTHALLSKDTVFFKLALTITDEQHRFGVSQRGALTAKSKERPHTLVMSATPIPRTLAMYMYGDLDVSIIDELPPGRQEIKTYLVDERFRERIDRFITNQVTNGRQVYIICPSIDESPAIEMKSVTEYTRNLSARLPESIRIAPLHGKMKSYEKEQTMNDFASGGIDVLVSTTVVEVGMDVPNAALMVIENSERFGLSQLHQLRGRVGRGSHQSYCVLFLGGGNEETLERLKAFCETSDGFKIAETDLAIRGPGDFFGNRQHGLPELKIADLQGGLDTLRESQAAAAEIGVEEIPNFPELHARIISLLESVNEV